MFPLRGRDSREMSRLRGGIKGVEFSSRQALKNKLKIPPPKLLMEEISTLAGLDSCL